MKRRGAFLSPVLVFAVAVGAGEACGQPDNPATQGGTCALTSDCQEGFECITQPDGTRQCSSDFSSIQHTEEAGAEAAAMPMDGAAQGDSTVPPQDSGAPPGDTGTPPQDTGSPPQDTGTPPQDTGTPPQDTGPPPQDTGTPPQDAGGG